MARRDLARAAASLALRVRVRVQLGLTDPANTVDIAEKLGVQVWYRKLPSLEGLFIRAPHPVILLSALRPAGRRSFTCGHELGHFCLDHDGRVDPVAKDGVVFQEQADDEYQASQFAAYLLMPKTTVQHAFAQRQTEPSSASPRAILAIAHWLGVGYATLLNHLHYNLRLLGRPRFEELVKKRPKQIVAGLADDRVQGASVVLVDDAWHSRPVDLQVGDVVVLDFPVTISGDCVVHRAGKDTHVEAVRPGTAHLEGDTWATYVLSLIHI